ncbi:MAG TPA: CRTAC1 family protein, partial [Planctomycetota bacterium]|nr:CRTAC1 family protein [Planctomycetota bacterium]
ATNEFMSAERLAVLRSTPRPAEGEARISYDFGLAREMLNAGESAGAVEAFERLWAQFRSDPARRNTPFAYEVHSLLAVSHLRLGEQENCVAHHGADSCLLPIQGSGVHQVPRGSRGAIAVLEDLLTADSRDLASRWLINLAYMTLGEYPDRVPPAWLIPPEAFRSETDFPRFPNVAGPLGLDVVGLAGGAIMEDLDGDGALDLLMSSWGLKDPLRCFRNNADGTFTERTEEAGLAGIVSGLNAVQADPDNDGDADVLVLRGGWLHEDGRLPNSLLRNRGDGVFDDVTEEAGLLSFHPTQVGAWADYDADGDLDLFVANESATGEPVHPCELFRNEGDGTFRDVAAEVGLAAVGYFKGGIWGDLDNDGLPDLYLSAQSKAPGNLLFHNEGRGADGRWTFQEVGERAGVREPARSFPTWCFDYDNDGWQDLFVSGFYANAGQVAAEYLGIANHAEKPRLYRNRRDGTFVDVSREARVDRVLLTMGCNYGDLDNDGWLDFYAATGNPDLRNVIPNRMFRNSGDRTFQDVTTAGGFGHLQKGHGVAFGDIDDDGDQDLYVKIGGAYTGDTFRSALFENPGNDNDWITLRLLGARSARCAIGARIKVSVDGPDGARDIYATVGTGSSFGASSLRQEIGLGPKARIREIEIRWPASGYVQRLGALAARQLLEVREGDPRPVPVPLKPFRLSSGSGH